MAKDLINALGSFGEGFIKTLQSERERKLQEQQFNQKMAFEMRQMNLMDAYRQKHLEIQGNQPFETKTGEVYPSKEGIPNFEKPLWMPPPQAEKPSKQTDTYENFSEKGYWNTKGKDDKPEWIPNPLYKEKPSGSGSGSSSGGKLDNQYLITAFGRLKNRGTGEEDKPYTPQQMDIDFNTVANDLLTPSVLGIVNGMRKGSGDYPTVEELINSFEKAGLKGKDAESAEKFLEYYSQIESSLAPTKVQWWK